MDGMKEKRCTCDDFTDEPCPVHFRENQLQNRVLELEARIAELERERDGWRSTAEQCQRNTDYYRGMVVQIGEALGPPAKTQDDGGFVPDVLCAKVPELAIDAIKRCGVLWNNNMRMALACCCEEGKPVRDEILAARLAEERKSLEEKIAQMESFTRGNIGIHWAEENDRLREQRDALAAALAEYAEKISIAAKEDAQLWAMENPSSQLIARVRNLWREADAVLEKSGHQAILASLRAKERQAGAVEALAPYQWRPIAEAHEDHGDIVLVDINDPGDVCISNVCAGSWDQDSTEMTHFALVPAFYSAPDQIERGEVKP